MNYTKSQSFHTLTHWQNGKQGTPEIKTLDDLLGTTDYNQAFYFAGWLEYPEGYTPQATKQIYLLAYAYHEQGAEAGEAYTTSYIKQTAGGTLYKRKAPDPLRVVYSAKYGDNYNYTNYLKIVTDLTNKTALVPESVVFPGIGSSSEVNLSYYIIDAGTVTTNTEQYLNNFKAENFTADYTGGVIIPYIHKYTIYVQRVTEGEEPAEIFSDAQDKTDIIINAGGAASGSWIARQVFIKAMQADEELRSIKELRQVPANLLTKTIKVNYNSPYTRTYSGTNNSSTAPGEAFPYIGGYFLLNNSQYCGGFTGDTLENSRAITPFGCPRMQLNSFYDSEISIANYDGCIISASTKYPGTLDSDTGVWTGVFNTIVDLQIQDDFKFFK